MHARTDTARAAAAALEAGAPVRALVGFDGFIDSITRLVGTRRSMATADYEPIATITAFADRCRAAAGKSANIEQVLIEERFGGNGPLMAGALARLGATTTFIGAVADGRGGLHPLFRTLAQRCDAVVPICPPSHTLCLEFDDGKLMLNDTSAVQAVTWERVAAAVGIQRLRGLVDPADLLGIVNWSLLGGVPEIWAGLRRDVFPHVAPRPRRLFIDLSDPAKRTDTDIHACIADLRALQAVPGLAVTLGLNLAEASRLCAVTGLPAPTGAFEALADTAAALREHLALDTAVIHPREGAAGATAAGSAWFQGPLAASPRLSTGAGDHFNAGVALAQTRGLPLDQCLATGCAVSGLYVRQAESPTLAQVCAFLRALPLPEPPRE